MKMTNSSSSARRLLARLASGATTTSTCSLTASWSGASCEPTRRRWMRPGFGHSHSDTTRSACTPTATKPHVKRDELHWRRAGGGSERAGRNVLTKLFGYKPLRTNRRARIARRLLITAGTRTYERLSRPVNRRQGSSRLKRPYGMRCAHMASS